MTVLHAYVYNLLSLNLLVAINGCFVMIAAPENGTQRENTFARRISAKRKDFSLCRKADICRIDSGLSNQINSDNSTLTQCPLKQSHINKYNCTYNIGMLLNEFPRNLHSFNLALQK